MQSTEAVKLFRESLMRVTKVKKELDLPYAFSEIRAYYHCQVDTHATMKTYAGANALAEVVSRDAGLTLVKADPVFPDGIEGLHGYTLNCTLTESGVAFDCWPEFGTVLQYLDLCNVKKDNSGKAEKLFEHVAFFFKPKWVYRVEPVFIPIDPKHIDQESLVLYE